MNWAQIILFAIYAGSTLIAGTACRVWLNPKEKDVFNRSLYLGENFLLGSIIIIGQMLLLSLVHLYKAPFLWSAVGLNFLPLCIPSVRGHLNGLWKRKIIWDVPLAAFVLLLGFFMFRNCYFLIDVDSHSTYLYAQKLWLEHGTSIFAAPALDIRVYVPHFNAVPYALGLSVFPGELLFPQLIVMFWTVIAALSVFGYVSHRFNRWYAWAAVAMCVFNDHIFFSGSNQWVIINSALIALLFAITYNFWESRARKDSFRFLLGLIFVTQLLANKYQVFYVMILLLGTGVLIQDDIRGRIKAILGNRRWMAGLALSCLICGFWFLKNFLATGAPAFPVFAGNAGPLDWTRDMAVQFNRVYAGPATLPQIFKFLSYLFVWPGVGPAKIVWISFVALPISLLFIREKKGIDYEFLRELCYWMAASIFILVGICLASFVDPRHYRYGIAVMSVAAVFALEFFLGHALRFPKPVIAVCIVLVGLSGAGVVRQHFSGRPSIQQNIAVLSGTLHTADVLANVFPRNAAALEAIKRNPEKFASGAWDTGIAGANPMSAFMLPSRPQVGLWHTTAVRWDSYQDMKMIEADLQSRGIQWIMSMGDEELVFETVEEYARRAIQFDRYPKEKGYNYGFPKELSAVK